MYALCTVIETQCQYKIVFPIVIYFRTEFKLLMTI